MKDDFSMCIFNDMQNEKMTTNPADETRSSLEYKKAFGHSPYCF